MTKKVPFFSEWGSDAMLVASLDGDDLPFLLEEARRQRADVVEIRLDVWGTFFREDFTDKLTRFKSKIAIPMLMTFRGGHPYPNWWQPYHWRALSPAALVDFEWNPKYPWKDIRHQAALQGVGLIISHHDYNATPSAAKLLSIAKAAYAKGAEMVKIATQVKSESDIRTLLEVSATLADHKKRITVMGMGALGGASRLAAPIFGSRLIYGFIGTPTAVGQWPFKDLQDRMRLLYPRYEEKFIERQKKRGVVL